MAFNSNSDEGGASKEKFNPDVLKKLLENISSSYEAARLHVQESDLNLDENPTYLTLLSVLQKLIQMIRNKRYEEAADLVEAIFGNSEFMGGIYLDEVFYLVIPFQSIALYARYYARFVTEEAFHSYLSRIEGPLNIFGSGLNQFMLRSSSTVSSASSSVSSTTSTPSTTTLAPLVDPQEQLLRTQAGGGDDELDDGLDSDDGLDDLVLPPEEEPFDRNIRLARADIARSDRDVDLFEDYSSAVEDLTGTYRYLAAALALVEGEVDNLSSDDNDGASDFYSQFREIQNVYADLNQRITNIQELSIGDDDAATLTTLQGNMESFNARITRVSELFQTWFSSYASESTSIGNLVASASLIGLTGLGYMGGSGGSV